MQSYDLAVIEAADLPHILQAVFTLKGKVTYFVRHRFQRSDACRML
jgi:hypothetical protein